MIFRLLLIVSLFTPIFLLFFATLCESVCIDGTHPWDPLRQTIELADKLDSLKIFICLISHDLSLLSMISFVFAV